MTFYPVRSQGHLALTLGIGTGTPRASSPRSSIMFLMSMERSATSFSARALAGFFVQSTMPHRVRRCKEGGEHTNFDLLMVVGHEGDGELFRHDCGG